MTDPHVILGYYCSHDDEPFGERTHLRERDHWNKPKKFPAGSPDPNTTKALTFGIYDYETKTYGPPPCPRSVPLIAATTQVTA